MPYSINFYNDQILSDGKTTKSLPAINRIFYVRHGEVMINGKKYGEDTAVYTSEPVSLEGSAEWSQLFRWEIALPNEIPNLLEGMNLLSNPKMSRVIMMMEMPSNSQWLFRLDRITVPTGRVSDRHQHPGPGIRVLLEGTFNVQQDCESCRMVIPGEPWWESGEDTVIAWASTTMHARFLRGMILPVDYQGRPDTAIWLSGDTKKSRGKWHYYVDEIITVR
ncbi:MAG: hypothetical protein AAF490_06820 [Chloroflexota bacterium]